MSLPKGYKRLEYIQSSGTQYIKTNIIPVAGDNIVLDFQFTTYSNDTWACSVYENTSNRWSCGLFQNAFYLDGFSASQTQSVTDRTIFTGDCAQNTTRALLFFAQNMSSGAYGFGIGKFFFGKYSRNGLLVGDFIPCQNTDGAIGLWDAVNEVFYGNAGTGAFTAGPVVPESADESEITELEYIQSSGTQYVDSGLKGNQNTRIDADYYTTATKGSIIGADSAWGSNMCTIEVHFAAFATSSYTYSSVPSGRHTVSLNKGVLLLDGATMSTMSGTFTTPFNMTLFALNRDGTKTEYGSIKLYSMQIYDNGLLERDYIPAMLTNGEVGLYDRVFHEFYRNAGTGEFIAGPEMEHEGYTELEYIESDGTNYLDTGVSAPLGFRVHCKVLLKEIASRLNMLFGSHDTASPYYRNFLAATAAGQWELGAYNPSDFGTSAAGVEYDIVASTISGDIECTINGKTLMQDQSIAVTTQRSDLTVYLFGLNFSGGTFPTNMRLWAFAMYLDAAETDLQRDFVPMLHPSGVAGLWDNVNERFYATATTTDLIAGPEAQTVPKAPANFRVESETDTLVTLAWDPMEEVLGYRLYRQGQLLADTTETSVSVAVEPFAGAVFTLTAYNENGEGKGASLTHYSIPENPLLYLVTDRTQADVTERNPKGYYAASDLNRVGYAVDYLAGRLKESGVIATVSPVLTWTDEDWATPGTMQNYLADVHTMRKALTLAKTTPSVPQDMEKLTYTEANHIELILLALDAHIKNMLAIVDAGWTSSLAYTGFYAKEAY